MDVKMPTLKEIRRAAIGDAICTVEQWRKSLRLPIPTTLVVKTFDGFFGWRISPSRGWVSINGYLPAPGVDGFLHHYDDSAHKADIPVFWNPDKGWIKWV